MTWSDRMKLAWTTFKREALPLYGWTLIFVGAIVVLIIAIAIGTLEKLRWIIPSIHSFGGAFSPDMPVPGMPPSLGLAPFHYFGDIHSFSRFLPVIGSIAGTLLLILIICWLAGSAFYTGIFNLTAKAYRENVNFKDFRFTGLFRILGWQAFLFLIQLILLAVGLIGAITLGHSKTPFIMIFLVIYALLVIAIGLYTLPWIISSGIYLLIHQEMTFREALDNSWRFFRRHLGPLWGYIGTFILIEIGVDILTRVSQGLAGIATLVVSPFIAILAIVWVLSLDDSIDYAAADSGPLTTDFTPPPSGLQPLDTIQPAEPKINLQKPEQIPEDSEDKTLFCPSCGTPDTGTAYCPQCGTKLH